ncbi:MAG TPA: DUF1385 domain-containing protein [bacterium]
MSKSNIQVGGQAVIEGVMMRSHDTYAVAVRRQDGSIYVRQRPFVSFVKRYRVLALPLLRGAVVLVESLILGIQALSFSGDVVMEEERLKDPDNLAAKPSAASEKSVWAKVWFGSTVVFSLAIGLFIFFYVPLLLTELLGAKTGFAFNLVDGVLRLVIFLLYLVAITLMKDIRRIFEYHGAEHKSIFAFESKKKLVPAVAKTFTRFHPRCGTSFLLIVMIVSIFVFMFLGKPEDVGDRLLRLAFIPLIGGISYEFIRLSDAGSRINFWKPFIAPGLWLQRLTTKEPDESQLEVAIVALKCALKMSTSDHPDVVFEHESMQMQRAS